jgi:hypothetical protein
MRHSQSTAIYMTVAQSACDGVREHSHIVTGNGCCVRVHPCHQNTTAVQTEHKFSLKFHRKIVYVTYMQSLNVGYIKSLYLHINTYKPIYATDIYVTFA